MFTELSMTMAQHVPSIVPSARYVSTPIGTSIVLLPCHWWSGCFGSGAFTSTSGRRTGDDCLERAIRVQHAAAEVVDELAQREADRAFVHARRLHVAAHAVKTRAAVVRQAALRRPRLTAHADDVRHGGDGLDVVHDRR